MLLFLFGYLNFRKFIAPSTWKARLEAHVFWASFNQSGASSWRSGFFILRYLAFQVAWAAQECFSTWLQCCDENARLAKVAHDCDLALLEALLPRFPISAATYLPRIKQGALPLQWPPRLQIETHTKSAGA